MNFIKTIGLPNKLTLIRILLIPFFTVGMLFDDLWTRVFVFFVFVAAAITDIFDGLYARKYKEVSVAGIFMDPLADKLLVSAALILFVSLKELKIPGWMVVLVISREYLVTGLRLMAISQNKVISADKVGKIKTTVQVIAIITILFIMIINSFIRTYSINLDSLPSGWLLCLDFFLRDFPFWLMLFVTVLTVYSGVSYFVKYGKFVLMNLQINNNKGDKL